MVELAVCSTLLIRLFVQKNMLPLLHLWSLVDVPGRLETATGMSEQGESSSGSMMVSALGNMVVAAVLVPIGQCGLSRQASKFDSCLYS